MKQPLQCLEDLLPFPPCVPPLVTGHLTRFLSPIFLSFFNFLTSPCPCSCQLQAGPQWSWVRRERKVTCADDRQGHEELAQQELLAEDLLQVLLSLHREALQRERAQARAQAMGGNHKD